MHDILIITHERPEFSRRAIEQLLKTCDSSMRVWIWQNGTHKETLEIVKAFSEHPNVYAVCISAENRYLREPTNWFWEMSDGQFLTKVDDDCLLPDDWATALRAAHDGAPTLGIAACWRFYDEDGVPELIARKVRKLPNGRRIMTHWHVQGSGYVMKRDVIQQLGPIRDRESFSFYCARASAKGWTVGWHVPFIHEEHMDDTRSPFCPYKTELDFRNNRPLSAIRHGIISLQEWHDHCKALPSEIQRDLSEGSSFFGFRGYYRKLRNRLARLSANRGRSNAC